MEDEPRARGVYRFHRGGAHSGDCRGLIRQVGAVRGPGRLREGHGQGPGTGELRRMEAARMHGQLTIASSGGAHARVPRAALDPGAAGLRAEDADLGAKTEPDGAMTAPTVLWHSCSFCRRLRGTHYVECDSGSALRIPGNATALGRRPPRYRLRGSLARARRGDTRSA